MASDDPLLRLFAPLPRNRRTDVILRRLAHETDAAAACILPRCIRSQRCCGPWEKSQHDASIALPQCLMLKVDTELDDIQLMDRRLLAFLHRMKDACKAEES
ncbi:MAG TPA: hypothetical protein VF744_15920 [Beijerinckiaceae bacterium]|jgi:hypothetical protein